MFNRLSTNAMLRSRRFADDVEISYSEKPKESFSTFDLSKIQDNCVIGIVGRRNSGKSTLVKDIITSRFKDITQGIVCSGSEKSNPFFRRFMAPTFAFSQKINEDHLTAFIQMAKDNPGEKKLIVIDDCAFDSAQRKSPALKEIVLNGRHLNITVILVAQSCVDLGSPSVRSNTDIVFMTRENLLPALEQAYKLFFSVFPTFRQFRELCEETKRTPYKCLVCDMSSFGTIHDMVKTYKAKL